MKNKGPVYCLALGGIILLLFLLNLFVGSVSIPLADMWLILSGHESPNASWQFIVLGARLPQALTALLSGGALAVSGLMLQTAFRNPLAGPDVFGINSGAGLGVALVMLVMGGSVTAGMITFTGFMAILLSAFVGAMLVTGVIFMFSSMVRNNVMLLIIGLMIGYLANSAISLLNFFATEEGVKSYMVWGMGNFGSVSMDQMPLFAAATLMGLGASVLFVKPLNALLLGTQYAENLGFNIRRVRNWLLVVTGFLTAVVTAFCGPVAFIGLAVPHVARMLLRTDNHQILLPGTILCGMAVALFCNVLCCLPGRAGVIPLNAVTPLIGAPIVIYVIARRR